MPRVSDFSPRREAVIRAVGEYAKAAHDRMNDGGSECFNGCAACAAHDRMIDAWVALEMPGMPAGKEGLGTGRASLPRAGS